MSYLKKIAIYADFKTTKTAFIKLGIDSNKIDSYFKRFQEAKDRGKINKLDEKNIDYWAKKSWHDFASFVDALEEQTTRSEEKREPWKANIPGADKVAENSDWVVYRVDSFDAAKTLGSRNWCNIRHPLTWRNYKEGREGRPTIFYFALSKTKSYKIKKMGMPIEYEDPWHKLAIESLKEYQMVWDANNDNHDMNEIKNTELKNFPEVKWEYNPNFCPKCKKGIPFCKCPS